MGSRSGNEALMTTKRTSLLLTKVGNSPHAFGIVDEVRKLMPGVWILGIESSEDSSGHPFDEPVANTNQLLLGNYPTIPESSRYLPPAIFRRFERDIGHLLRLADRVFVHDLRDHVRHHGHDRVPTDTYDTRLQMVMQHAVYWNHILESRQVQAIVFPNLPHGMWDASLLSVSKARDIPHMFFHEVPPFRGTLYLYEGSDSIGDLESGRRILSAARTRYGLIEDSPDRKLKLWKQANIVQTELELSVQHSQVRNIKRIVALLGRPRKVRSIFRAIQRRRSARLSQKSEKAAYSNVDLGENFFFLELQLPHNATTLVKGREYPRQTDLIRYIAAALPDSQELVIRESPRFHERKLYRPTNFWSEISKIPNVRVIDTRHSLREISERAAVVVELSYSSLALLHLLSGKSVVFLTDTHLGPMPNMFLLANFSRLSDALQTARDASVIDEREVISSCLRAHINDLSPSTIESALSWYPSAESSDPSYGERLRLNVARAIASWCLSRLSEWDGYKLIGD